MVIGDAKETMLLVRTTLELQASFVCVLHHPSNRKGADGVR